MRRGPIPTTPATMIRALAMAPLYFALMLTGGDFDGLIEWWIRSRGGSRVSSAVTEETPDAR